LAGVLGGEQGVLDEMGLMIAVFLVGALLVMFVIARLSSDSGGDDSDGGGGGFWNRGGGWPKGPRPKPRDPEPSWWPEFERDFHAYVHAQATRRTLTPTS
jgi:hypothetical protein